MIQHHGDSLLRLAGLREPFTWRPLQAEVVLPRQFPDGLLEVQVAGQDKPDLFVLEIATYPEQRIIEQVFRDLAVVYLDRHSLPEVVVLVLYPKGNLRVGGSADLQSRSGWTQLQARWRVVELWTVPAEELLAANDVGLIPWVPLSSFADPVESVLQQCRERIDQQARAEEHANLLAVTQVLTRLKYNDSRLLSFLGGYQVMIESPLIQELLDQRSQQVKHESILRVLTARFESVPQELAGELQTVRDDEQLDGLLSFAALCPDLDTFRQRLKLWAGVRTDDQ